MTEIKKFPIPSAEQENIEESLGLVWHCREKGICEKEAVSSSLEKSVNPLAYGKLIQKGLTQESGSHLDLTARGEELAKGVIRRHRLAERLLSDVLSLDKNAIDPNACQLEHIISMEVTESICTLLGHPVECPHGSSIPPGDCCKREQKQLDPIVVSVDKMSAGDEGKIAYLRLQAHPELHKLLSLGLVPGTIIHLHQTYPTFVLELGETQLAMEEDVARNIYVRKGKK